GVATFIIPKSSPENTFGALFNAGTFSVTVNGATFNYIFNIDDPLPTPPAFVTPAILSSPSSLAPMTVFTVNYGAIDSASTSGLSSMISTLDAVQNASQNTIGDLNNRIARARWGKGPGGPSSYAASAGSTTRYLNFAARLGIDYRVALGLVEGEEVEIAHAIPAGGLPLAMVGGPIVFTSAVVVPTAAGSKSPVDDKVVIEDVNPRSRFEVFTEFDYGFYDLDNINRITRGSDTDTYAGSVGMEYRLVPNVVLGGAFTYLDSETDLTGRLGSSDLEGQIYSTYITIFVGNSYLDFLYSYGEFDNSITRNTLLGSIARGDTESDSHNFAVNGGHTFRKGEAFSYGPSTSLNYATGQVDGYIEKNGGAANLYYPDHDFESLIGRVGAYTTCVIEVPYGTWTTQVGANWAHEYNPNHSTITTNLETSPFALVTGGHATPTGSFSASRDRGSPGTDWAELGLVTRLDIKDTDCHIELGYQGMFFREDASGHFGSVKFGYDW
ncbi:MAG: autotransporter outer membrane beta-barrel domain-containing protein, partial [Verrucomicrobiae bacterium]|nr:autotransporter outer membrane beta-barrel domain-containing protein [Verrucomicrobiae bacterium]